MKTHTLFAGALAGLFALASGPVVAEEEGSDSLETAKEACRLRAVEGSQYGIDDAEVASVAQVDADRYQIEIRSPNGDYRCVVTAEGEIFSADEET